MKSPFDHFSILAPFYEHFIHYEISQRFIALLDAAADGIVLDAGGGTGRVAQYLRDRVAQIVVADETFKMLQEARAKDGLNPTCCHIEDMPFKDNSFDRILMVDAFHHMSNQAQTIKEMWRVLAPGGRIIIEEPDVRVFGVKLLALGEKLALMRSHFLTPAEIASLFGTDARVRIEAEDSAAWIIAEKGIN